MKNYPLLLITGFLLAFIACDNGTTYEELKSIKPVSERVYDLHKTMDEIKTFEEKAALFREENYYLEYEYPIGENESYVVAYRFNETGCFEIKLTAYLKDEDEAQKIVSKVTSNLKSSTNITSTTVVTDHYKWNTANNDATLDMDIQNIERGIVSLTIIPGK